MLPGTKIDICHYPPGNTDNPQWISIDEHAWNAHKKHGDHKDESRCISQSPSTTTNISVLSTTTTQPTDTTTTIEESSTTSPSDTTSTTTGELVPTTVQTVPQTTEPITQDSTPVTILIPPDSGVIVDPAETSTTIQGSSVTTSVGHTGTLPETGYGTEALLVTASILILIGIIAKRFQHHG